MAIIRGGNEGDILIGTRAADQIEGLGGSDYLDGGVGDDLLDGGDDVDWAAFRRARARVSVDLATGVAVGDASVGRDTLIRIENVIGGLFDDQLSGDAGDNEIHGGGGGDFLFGRGGDDRLVGQGGNDILFGGEGRDALFGGDEDDQLNGDDGDDRLVGGGGDDFLRGGRGADLLDGGEGVDTASYTSSNSGIVADLVAMRIQDGEGGTDRIVTTGGESTIERIVGSDSGDVFQPGKFILFDGGPGVDTVDLSKLTSGASVDIDRGEVIQDGVLIARLQRVEAIVGSQFADILRGSGAAEGAGGDDVIVSACGADRLGGGAGDDRLHGGTGDDILIGGGGGDFLDGSGGMDRYEGGGDDDLLVSRLDGVSDTFVFLPGDGADRIFRYEAGVDRIGISAAFGFSDGADAIANMTAAVLNASGHAVLNLNGVDIIQLIGFRGDNPGKVLADLAQDIFVF